MTRVVVVLALVVQFTWLQSAFAIPMALPGDARAEYNPATGNIQISANSILGWYVEHVGHESMTGDAPMGLPNGFGLVTDNDTRIGESWFSPSSADVNLGNVAALGIPDDGSLKIFWNESLDFPIWNVEVDFVPEPTAAALALLGLCSLIPIRCPRCV